MLPGRKGPGGLRGAPPGLPGGLNIQRWARLSATRRAALFRRAVRPSGGGEGTEAIQPNDGCPTIPGTRVDEPPRPRGEKFCMRWVDLLRQTERTNRAAVPTAHASRLSLGPSAASGRCHGSRHIGVREGAYVGYRPGTIPTPTRPRPRPTRNSHRRCSAPTGAWGQASAIGEAYEVPLALPQSAGGDTISSTSFNAPTSTPESRPTRSIRPMPSVALPSCAIAR